MGRRIAWVVGALSAIGLYAAPASAQVHVDVGVFSPSFGAHVVVGRPNVYVVDRYYPPVYAPVYAPPPVVYVQRPRYYREVHYYPAYPVYYGKDYRKAERSYRRDVRFVPPGHAKRGGGRGRR